MKRNLAILSLLLVFWTVNCFAQAVPSVTLSVLPNPANIGQSVTFSVSGNIPIATLTPCSTSVYFDDGAPATWTCNTTGACNGLFTHSYTSDGDYTVGVTTNLACAGTGSVVSLQINCQALNVVTSALPAGIVGQPYSAQLLSIGGVAPITWDLEDGGLPDGLTLTPTGLITGIPTTYGPALFSVNAEDSCNAGAQIEEKDLSINVASPATAELTITRMQLSFDNGRAETTVNRNQPGLRANADLRFNGSGLLKAYWEVDGSFLSQVNQHLTYGKSIRLTTPAVPFLPTFVEGTHRVRLVITNPANEIPFPEAIYYVTSEESTAGLAPIRALEPRNYAELAFASQTFSWEGTSRAAMYLVEFFEKTDDVPVASAYTKDVDYTLPEAILADRFSSGKAYLWGIKSYDAEGNLLGVSESSRFVFQ